VGTKRATRREAGGAHDLSLASIHGYLAAQAHKRRDCCPHADGSLRAAWLEGYEAGIKAMAVWGENVSHAIEDHRRS